MEAACRTRAFIAGCSAFRFRLRRARLSGEVPRPARGRPRGRRIREDVPVLRREQTAGGGRRGLHEARGRGLGYADETVSPAAEPPGTDDQGKDNEVGFRVV